MGRKPGPGVKRRFRPPRAIQCFTPGKVLLLTDNPNPKRGSGSELCATHPRLRVLKSRYFHRASTGGAEFWGCGGGEEALEFGDAAGGFEALREIF